jgi:group I intron endonuclease
MNHYLYRIINRENGKFYIGVHSCRGDYYDSKYWGSGCFSKDAKKNPDKYLRVLICQAESRKEVLKLEALFVTQELVDDPMCYNLQTGGLGGSQKGLIFSEESRAKLSAAKKGNQNMLGKSHSEETKAKMSAASKGNQNTLGKSHSEESKAKMSAAQKARPKVECPHCEKAGGARVMHRWHFDNCKSR